MYRSKREKYDIIKSQLDNERSSFTSHWRDLGEYILPRRPRFFLSDVNKGDKRNQKIIDATATLSARTLRSGMMSGVTSPARPWFKLTTQDPNLSESGPVKTWLHSVTQRMTTVFLRSNLYNILPIIYGDLGVFGTACMFMEESFDDNIRFSSFPIGSYWVAKGYDGRVNTFMREFRMTTRQMIDYFGIEQGGDPNKINWDVFSPEVKNAYDQGFYETWFDVVHVIMPNDEYDPDKLEARFKKYISCYYEKGNSSGSQAGYQIRDDRFLRESGYDYFPVLAPRWETTGEDVYGTDCPGMIALGDIKQLQLGEKRSAQAIEKMINPPMVGPTSLRSMKASILPGDITFSDEREGVKGFRPAHEVNFRILELEQKQEQVRHRIRRAFFEDLFLMLANTDRRQITAREIDERHEEKLLALGPVLEQLNQDLLDPLIDNAFDIMVKKQLIPEPPEELQGEDLKVEYISIMAQAQKLVGIGGVERFAGFVGQLAGAVPSVLDKVNSDQFVDVYADLTSIPPDLVYSDDKVEEIRSQRQMQMQQQQQMQAMSAATKNVKDLSQASMEGENALTQLINQANAGGLV